MADPKHFTGSVRKQRVSDTDRPSLYGILSDIQENDEHVFGHADLEADGDEVEGLTYTDPDSGEEFEPEASTGVLGAGDYYFNDALGQASLTNEAYRAGTQKTVKARRSGPPWTQYNKYYIWTSDKYYVYRMVSGKRRGYQVFSWKYVGNDL
jgi:hypothetical protein